jgi:hypothetical protein
MYKSRLETRNFYFETFGTTKKDALKQLKKGLIMHGQQYGIDLNWYHEYIEEINTVEIKQGVVYRDGEIIGGNESCN